MWQRHEHDGDEGNRMTGMLNHRKRFKLLTIVLLVAAAVSGTATMYLLMRRAETMTKESVDEMDPNEGNVIVTDDLEADVVDLDGLLPPETDDNKPLIEDAEDGQIVMPDAFPTEDETPDASPAEDEAPDASPAEEGSDGENGGGGNGGAVVAEAETESESQAETIAEPETETAKETDAEPETMAETDQTEKPDEQETAAPAETDQAETEASKEAETETAETDAEPETETDQEGTETETSETETETEEKTEETEAETEVETEDETEVETEDEAEVETEEETETESEEDFMQVPKSEDEVFVENEGKPMTDDMLTGVRLQVKDPDGNWAPAEKGDQDRITVDSDRILKFRITCTVPAGELNEEERTLIYQLPEEITEAAQEYGEIRDRSNQVIANYAIDSSGIVRITFTEETVQKNAEGEAINCQIEFRTIANTLRGGT